MRSTPAEPPRVRQRNKIKPVEISARLGNLRRAPGELALRHALRRASVTCHPEWNVSAKNPHLRCTSPAPKPAGFGLRLRAKRRREGLNEEGLNEEGLNEEGQDHKSTRSLAGRCQFVRTTGPAADRWDRQGPGGPQ
jgi:hypothetical protein